MVCHISFRDIDFHPYTEGVRVLATTDVPSHLFLRISQVEPQIHTKTGIRRGYPFIEDLRYCFVSFTDYEQYQDGDTLIHTWWLDDWPVCTTKWVYVFGSQAGETCVSTSPLFKYHNDGQDPIPPPIIEAVFVGSSYNRTLQSYGTNWAQAWGGSSVTVLTNYGAPYYIVMVTTGRPVNWTIRRAHFDFPTWEIPVGATIINAQLEFFIKAKTGTGSVAKPYVQVTKGVHGVPPSPADWAPQNPETQVGAERDFRTLVVGTREIWPFNDYGKTLIVPNFISRFCVRQQHDVENVQSPTGTNEVQIWTWQYQYEYRPWLRVWYSP